MLLQATDLTLADLRPGQKGGFLKVVSSDNVFKGTMASLGVISGCHVELDRPAPLGEPRIYNLAGYNLGRSNSDAKHIIIRLEN